MKQIVAIITAAILIMSLTLNAFAAESIAVKFENAAGKTVSGGTNPVHQMKKDYSEFVEGSAFAVTFTSEDAPYLNLRSKTSPFSGRDNVWMFIEPSSISDGVAYFDYADVKDYYLNGTCQNSGKKAVDIQPDFEAFLKDSCDWIGIYNYNNTVTVTKIEIVKEESDSEPAPDDDPVPGSTKTASDTFAFIYVNSDYHALLVGGHFLAMPHRDVNGYCPMCNAVIESAEPSDIP